MLYYIYIIECLPSRQRMGSGTRCLFNYILLYQKKFLSSPSPHDCHFYPWTNSPAPRAGLRVKLPKWPLHCHAPGCIECQVAWIESWIPDPINQNYLIWLSKHILCDFNLHFSLALSTWHQPTKVIAEMMCKPYVTYLTYITRWPNRLNCVECVKQIRWICSMVLNGTSMG